MHQPVRLSRFTGTHAHDRSPASQRLMSVAETTKFRKPIGHVKKPAAGILLRPMETTSGHERGLFDATVIANEPICVEHYRLRVRIAPETPFPASAPGQFVQLACGPSDFMEHEDRPNTWEPGQLPQLHNGELTEPVPFLRRPYSIAARIDHDLGTDLDVVYRVTGLGTHFLERLAEGDPANLIGPLGNRFELPEDKSLGLLVGGGVGLPPMFYLAEAMQEEGWFGCAFVGATTGDLLAVTMTGEPAHTEGGASFCVTEFAGRGLPTVITTDDGTIGMTGRITDGLRNYLQTQPEEGRAECVIFVCGPEPMMKAVAELARVFRVEAQACVEQPMACGMSTCQSCVVRIKGIQGNEPPHGVLEDGTPWRYRLACTDGPVFNTEQVVW